MRLPGKRNRVALPQCGDLTTKAVALFGAGELYCQLLCPAGWEAVLAGRCRGLTVWGRLTFAVTGRPGASDDSAWITPRVSCAGRWLGLALAACGVEMFIHLHGIDGWKPEATGYKNQVLSFSKHGLSAHATTMETSIGGRRGGNRPSLLGSVGLRHFQTGCNLLGSVKHARRAGCAALRRRHNTKGHRRSIGWCEVWPIAACEDQSLILARCRRGVCEGSWQDVQDE